VNGQITGIGLTGGSGATIGADGGAIGISITVGPPAPEGLGLNIGDGNLLLIVFLWFLRRF